VFTAALGACVALTCCNCHLNVWSQTGHEANVDRLMKSITSFIAEISDEFKIVLVDAIKTLCLKFPHKYQILMNFMSQALREEGGYDYKKAIVRYSSLPLCAVRHALHHL